jgi:Xaa-Pro aminopeptidase
MAQTISSNPRLSLNERDRRYAAIREQLRERGIDCLIVTGSDLTYLTNYLPGELFGLLPTNPDIPLTVQIMGRYLVDVSPQVLLDGQDWVSEVRAANSSEPTLERIKELKLEGGTIAVTRSRSSTGGLSHGFYADLQAACPNAKIVDATDILLNLRTTKSEEEIALIDRANRIFDAGVARVAEYARPGMRGAEVVQEAINAMVAAGGDLESTVGFNFGAEAMQNPILGHLCLDREIQPGDMGTLTAHAHYKHYAGHSDAEVSFGEPRQLHRELFDAVLYVRDEVLKHFRDGVTQRDIIDAYRTACNATGFRWSPHSQIHQYGIDVPEFPGPAFRAEGGGEGGANFVLRSGMIYSVSPTLVAKDNEQRMLGGTSLVVAKDGYRELGDRKVEIHMAGS